MASIAEIRAQYPQYQDMSDEQLAGAMHRKFYSDMPVEEFNAKIGLAPQQAMPQGHNVPEFDPGVAGYDPKTGLVENDGGAVDNAGAFSLSGVEGLPIVGPTIAKGVRGAAAGIVAPFSDKSFGQVYDEMGRRSAKVQADNPNAALAGEITGQVLGSAVPMTAAPRAFGLAGSLGSRVLAGGASNAALAGADTAARGGSGEEIAQNALLGGTVAAALPIGAAGTKGVLRGLGIIGEEGSKAVKAAAKGAPTDVGLKAQTDDMYAQMRQAGIHYDNNAVDQQLVTALKEIRDEGFDASIAEKPINWLKSIHGRTRGPVTFDTINNMIVRTNEEIGGSQGAERAVFKIIRKHLDKLEEAAPMTSTTAMPKAQFNSMRLKARSLAKRNIQQRAIQEVVDKSGTYAAGEEAGIRNGIGNLLRSKRGTRLFPVGSPERKALQNVQLGRKLLQQVGKLGFDVLPKAGNAALVPLLGAAGGYTYGGPEYALAGAAAGAGAKFAGPKLTNRALEQAMAAIRSGNLRNTVPVNPKIEGAKRALGILTRSIANGT